MTAASNKQTAKVRKPSTKLGDRIRRGRTGRSSAAPSEPGKKTRQTSNPGEQTLARATKQDHMLSLLSRPQGASLDDLMKATSWQKHSVHGFLSGTVKKKLGLELSTAISADGIRCYRVAPRFEK